MFVGSYANGPNNDFAARTKREMQAVAFYGIRSRALLSVVATDLPAPARQGTACSKPWRTTLDACRQTGTPARRKRRTLQPSEQIGRNRGRDITRRRRHKGNSLPRTRTVESETMFLRRHPLPPRSTAASIPAAVPPVNRPPLATSLVCAAIFQGMSGGLRYAKLTSLQARIDCSHFPLLATLDKSTACKRAGY